VPVETTIVVQRATPTVDTPQILEILVNGKLYDGARTYDTTAVTVAILVVDNGSGIKEVTLLDSVAVGVGVISKGVAVPMTNDGHGWWTGSPVLFNARLRLNLIITATNNIARDTRKLLTIFKAVKTVTPAQ